MIVSLCKVGYTQNISKLMNLQNLF